MVIVPSSGYIPHLAGRLPDSTWCAPGVAGQTATHAWCVWVSEVSPVPGLNDHPETWPRCGCRQGLVQQILRGQLRGVPALAVAAPGRRADSW